MTHHIDWGSLFSAVLGLIIIGLTVMWFYHVGKLLIHGVRYLRTKDEADKPARSELRLWFINTLILAKSLFVMYHIYKTPIDAFMAHLKA